MFQDCYALNEVSYFVYLYVCAVYMFVLTSSA